MEKCQKFLQPPTFLAMEIFTNGAFFRSYKRLIKLTHSNYMSISNISNIVIFNLFSSTADVGSDKGLLKNAVYGC